MAAYLQAVIMRVIGWAAWCAYRSFQAGLNNSEDSALQDLLAIRLSWECLVDNKQRDLASPWYAWQKTWMKHLYKTQDSQQQSMLLLWQRAHEISYQSELFQQLNNASELKVIKPSVQAVFCIDVRSEVFRRHFESQADDIQTLGFAGFFGLPISYTPLATKATRPQLPGLLAAASIFLIPAVISKKTKK